MYYCYNYISNILNTELDDDYKLKKINKIIETWHAKLNYVDLSCYTKEEQEIIHTEFWKELKNLYTNKDYYNAIFQVDLNGSKYVKPQYILENLRAENIYSLCRVCTSYPCRYTKDSSINIKIITECNSNVKTL